MSVSDQHPIHILPIEDAKTGEIAFEAGELDITRLAISSVQQYRDAAPENSTLVEHPSLFYEWLGMNVDSPPFDDERVRKAVQYAVDVDSVIEAAYFGVPERATGIISPGLVGHRPENMIQNPDLDEARRLLAEAGHPNGFKCTLDVHNVTDHVSTVQVIQSNLAQIGIEVQINQHDSGTFWVLGIEAEGDAWKDVQLVYNRYSMAPDPFWATAWFVPEQVGEWNWERWNSPEYGELHRAAVRETDLDMRGQLCHRMQDMMKGSRRPHLRHPRRERLHPQQQNRPRAAAGRRQLPVPQVPHGVSRIHQPQLTSHGDLWEVPMSQRVSSIPHRPY